MIMYPRQLRLAVTIWLLCSVSAELQESWERDSKCFFVFVSGRPNTQLSIPCIAHTCFAPCEHRWEFFSAHALLARPHHRVRVEWPIEETQCSLPLQGMPSWNSRRPPLPPARQECPAGVQHQVRQHRRASACHRSLVAEAAQQLLLLFAAGGFTDNPCSPVWKGLTCENGRVTAL